LQAPGFEEIFFGTTLEADIKRSTYAINSFLNLFLILVTATNYTTNELHLPYPKLISLNGRLTSPQKGKIKINSSFF
jgi:hypothetical protein